MGVSLKVSSSVLVPREETELLGYTAIDAVKDVHAPRIIDVCTGSGNLACALAMKLPEARVWALDVTRECVALARENVDRLSLQSRVLVMESDLFSALTDTELERRTDLVVCNPPYISSRTLGGEKKPLLQHEPREAFEGGPYGISIIQRLSRDAVQFLSAGRPLCFEFGAGQCRMIAHLLERSGLYEPISLIPDQAGVPRVAVAHKKASV
jgi:release factor glutamine methyltransferase